jgi:hypothetical protein
MGDATFGKVLADHALCGGVDAGVGDLVEPLAELVVEVTEIAKAAAEEEVFTATCYTNKIKR